MTSASMTIRCIGIESPEEWRSALHGIAHGFAHTWENCHAMMRTSAFRTFLFCVDSDEGRIVCPLAERVSGAYSDLVSPHGFGGCVGNGSAPVFRTAWEQFANSRGYVCVYLALNPLLGRRDCFDVGDIHTQNVVFVLDLTRDPADLFHRLHRNRRRALRDITAKRRTVVTDRRAVREFCLNSYAAFFASRGASAAYDFSTSTIEELLSLENVALFGACADGRIDAAIAAAWTAAGGELLFNFSLPGGEHHSTLLVWCAVEHLRALGVPWLNLGGGITPGDGVARFKMRFGPEARPFFCVKHVWRQGPYEELCRAVGADPNDISGYFPPYHRARTDPLGDHDQAPD